MATSKYGKAGAKKTAAKKGGKLKLSKKAVSKATTALAGKPTKRQSKCVCVA
jgi:hypothetical protein